MKFESKTILSIPPEKIRPFPEQPRSWIDPKSIKELADTFDAIGEQTEAGIVRRLKKPENGFEFELIAGERRLEACKLKGRLFQTRIAEVADEKEQFRVAFVDNVQRETLSLLDLCRGLKYLHEECGMTQKQAGVLCGKSAAWAFKRIRLMELPTAILKQMGPQTPEDQRLSFSNAEKLLEATPDRKTQLDLAKKVAGNTTVRQTKQIIQQTASTGNFVPRSASVRRTEDFRNFYGSIEGMSGTLERRVGMEANDLVSLLQGGSLEEVDDLIGFLAGIANNADTLKTAVKKFAKESAKKK